MCLCVLSSASQPGAGSVRAASWPCPADGGGFSLSPELPQGRAQHAPATAARRDLFMLQAAFKTHRRFKQHPSCCLTPLHWNSRVKKGFIRAPLLATGSISRATSQLGEVNALPVLGQHFGNDTGTATPCSLVSPHTRAGTLFCLLSAW